MEHSDEYRKFINWLHSSVRERDGYWPYLFNNIYEWEREELEDAIWNLFNRESFIQLAYYLPQLTRYDGISALKRKLSECTIPSDWSRTIAGVLYDSTDDDSYLDVFKENYEKSKENRYSIVAELSYCKPGKKMFDILCDFYLNGDEKLSVDTAAAGIVYCINDVKPDSSVSEAMKYIPEIRQLTECGKPERTERLNRIIRIKGRI